MDSDRSEEDLMSRRTVIGAAAATVVSTGAAAQEAAPRPKGPRVWLDMDQKELDDAYDQSVYAPNRDQLNRRRASESELVRARLGAPRRVAYGATPHEMLDIYATRNGNARSRYLFMAAPGAPVMRRIQRTGQRPSCAPGRISWSPISSTRSRAAAT